MGSFAVAGIQLDLEGGDNLARIGEEVAATKRRLPWLDMIILPELCTYGPKIVHAGPPGSRAEIVF
jgi:predicted amidohydrolase